MDKKLKKLRYIGVPLFYLENYIYTQKRSVIGKYNIETDEYQVLNDIPLSINQKIMIRFRMLQRIFRMEARAVTCYGKQYIFFAFCGNIYSYHIERNELSRLSIIKAGNSMPLQILADDTFLEGKISLIYGDYGNLGGKSVCIHCIDIETKEDKIIYRFEKGTIFHIHAVIYDTENKQYFILTGDDENESGIYVADSRFSKVSKFIHGSTEYRACNLMIENTNSYIYAMDSTFQQNYICNLINRNGKWEMKKVYAINGPNIYSVQSGRDIFFSTTVESQFDRKLIRKILGNRLADSIQRREVTIIRGNLEDGFSELMSVEKDRYPMGLCGFGNARFVPGVDGKGLLIYFMGVKKLDGRVIVIGD